LNFIILTLLRTQQMVDGIPLHLISVLHALNIFHPMDSNNNGKFFQNVWKNIPNGIQLLELFNQIGFIPALEEHTLSIPRFKRLLI
jgi:hypothetical protein